MPPSYRIGVVGFGVAGGAISTLLARAGHEMTLLERAPMLGPVGAGFLLQPSGQGVLRDLGLLEGIADQSAVIRGLKAHNHRGKLLVDLHYPPPGHAFGVHRALLFDSLRNAVECAGVEIRTGVEVSGRRRNAGPVLAIASDGTEHGPFDFLIGCDGSRSSLRALLPRARRCEDYEFGALWGTGRCTTVRDHVRQVARKASRLAGLLPVGDDRCTFFWGLHRRELEAIRAKPFEIWKQEVGALFPEALETLDDIGSHERMVFAGYLHTRPPVLHDESLVLIGDSAHAMSPHLGQGANLSLLDAECLARHLSQESAPQAAFQSYAQERLHQTRYYSFLSANLSSFFQSTSNLRGTLRDIGLPIMNAIPWVRRQMELSLAGAKQGFLDRLGG